MSIKSWLCASGRCAVQQRYVLTSMMSLAIIVSYCMRLCLRIALTMIALQDTPPRRIQEDVCPGNVSRHISGGAYNWTEKQQDLVVLSFFPGYILTHIPGGLLADKYGGRYVLSINILLSACITFLTPLVVTSLGWIWLVLVRFLLGMIQGPLLPTIAALLAQWVPVRQRSTLGGLVYAGVFLGSLVGNLISDLLMGYFKSWSSVFYVWGSLAVAWVVIFMLTCYSRPSVHPFITDEEKSMLAAEIGEVKTFGVPWKSMLTDFSVVALIFLQVGHDWITYVFIIDFPKLFSALLKYDVAKNGGITSASFGIMWLFSVISGWVSDFLVNRHVIQVLQVRKLYAVISALGPGMCSVLAMYMGCNTVPVVALLWTSMVLTGPWYPGPKVNSLDISLNFSGILMSFTNGAGIIAGMVVPYLLDIIAPDIANRRATKMKCLSWCTRCRVQQRYVLTIMTCLAIIVCYSMRLCLHISLTKIAVPIVPSPHVVEEVCPGNVSTDIEGGSYNLTEKQQGIILLSFFPGYVLTHVPGGLLADKYGGRHVLSVNVVITSFITIATPVVITSLNWLWLVGLRFVLGLVQGPLFPSVAALLSQWVPKRQRSTLGGLVYAGVFLGSVTGNLISGLLIGYFKNWPIVFYVWGAISLVWVVFFMLTCYSRPSEHPFITAEEKLMLATEIGEKKSFKIPWKSILTDFSVVSLIFVQCGHDWLTFTYITDLPKFFSDVLKFNVAENGVITSASFAIMWVFSVICGWICDYIINNEMISILRSRKLCAVISCLGPSSCSVGATYVGCNSVLVVGLLWIGMVLMGPWFPGPKVNSLDMSLNFSGVLMSIINGFGVTSGVFVPYVVAVVAPDGTLKQWQNVFWLSFFVSVVSLIVYLIGGSASRAKWDFVTEEEAQSSQA